MPCCLLLARSLQLGCCTENTHGVVQVCTNPRADTWVVALRIFTDWFRCAQTLELTQMAKKGAHFRCPQHYCAVCQKSGDGVDMVKCIRCPTAYHSSCMPKDIQRLLPHAKVWPNHNAHFFKALVSDV